MDTIADLHDDGHAFLAAAEKAGLDAPVPHCPGWDVRRLVRHVGKVFERTAIVVEENLDGPPDRDRFSRFPEDGGAYDRFREVLTEMVDVLRAADPEAPAWNFTGASEVTAFWPRRMANEIAVHRWDAEEASGAAPGPVRTERAVDGIDELLTVLLPFSAAQTATEVHGSVHLHCTDTEGEWLTVLDGGTVTTTREHAKGDLAVKGPASTLFLWAWNRAPLGSEGLESFGDPSLADAWSTIGL
jgi:uncharacterized protein (TIGR03083 family)